MRIKTILLIFLLGSGLAAENLEKTQKKELEAQVKTMTAEAQTLERAGQLAEARAKYAESQALIEMKEVTDAIKHLDEEIQKRVKDSLNESHKLYEARKFKEAAAVAGRRHEAAGFPGGARLQSCALLLPAGRSRQGSRISEEGQSGHG